MLLPVARQVAIFNPEVLLEFQNLTHNVRKYSVFGIASKYSRPKTFNIPYLQNNQETDDATVEWLG
jgi:hypothetical protein